MVATGFMEILIVLLLSVSPANDLPSDLLAFVDPAAGLHAIGQASDEASLAKLIAAKVAGAVTEERAPAPGVTKELEGAIQNLASSSEKIRGAAREKLVAAGPAVKPRLEEVARTDARRAEEAKKALQALADAASSSAADEDLARTFAIRLAAEKGYTALLPQITSVAASTNPFVSSTARAAARTLEKTTAPGTAAGAGATTATIVVDGDLAMRAVRALPATTTAIAAFDLRLPAPGALAGLTLEKLFESVAKSLPPGAGAEDLDQARDEARSEVIGFVRRFGNLRPERLVVANVGSVGPRGGGMGIIARGVYQPDVLRATLHADEATWKTTEVEGSTVYNSAFLRLVLLSDREVLFLPLMASNHFPLANYLRDYNAGKDVISESTRLELFAKTLEQPFYTRALALTGESLMGEIQAELEQGAPANVAAGVKGMTEIELTIQQDESGGSTVRLEGRFEKDEHAKSLSDFLDASVKEGIQQLELLRAQTDIDVLKTVLEALKSIKISAEGTRGIFRMTVPKLEIADLLGGFARG